MRRLTSSERLVLSHLDLQLNEFEQRFPMTGGIARLSPYIVNIVQGGVDFDFIIYHLESKSWYDNTEIDWSMFHLTKHESIKEGDVVIDLGCNSGFTTCWYGLKVGNKGRVYAYDCMPWNAIATRAQCRLNRLENVAVFDKGVSDHDGSLVIDAATSRTIEQRSAQQNALAVELVAMDSLQRFEPTFIKCDIEGAEHEISLVDFSRFRRLRAIFVEFHPQYIKDRGVDPEDTIRNFIKSGFIPRADNHLGPTLQVEEIVRRGWNVYFSRE